MLFTGVYVCVMWEAAVGVSRRLGLFNVTLRTLFHVRGGRVGTDRAAGFASLLVTLRMFVSCGGWQGSWVHAGHVMGRVGQYRAFICLSYTGQVYETPSTGSAPHM